MVLRKRQMGDVGPRLAVCGKLCKQRMDQKLQQYGVTQAQAQMILCLIRAEETGEMNQQEMGRQFQIKASTVNGIVERLEEKGFLTRVTDRRDNRRRCLAVTDKGRRLEAELDQRVGETEEMMLRGMTETEKQELRRLLDCVAENLKGGAEQ